MMTRTGHHDGIWPWHRSQASESSDPANGQKQHTCNKQISDSLEHTERCDPYKEAIMSRSVSHMGNIDV